VHILKADGKKEESRGGCTRPQRRAEQPEKSYGRGAHGARSEGCEGALGQEEVKPGDISKINVGKISIQTMSMLIELALVEDDKIQRSGLRELRKSLKHFDQLQHFDLSAEDLGIVRRARQLLESKSAAAASAKVGSAKARAAGQGNTGK